MRLTQCFHLKFLILLSLAWTSTWKVTDIAFGVCSERLLAFDTVTVGHFNGEVLFTGVVFVDVALYPP